MTIIDDYSRKIWLYVLKEKSEAFGKFRDWCKMMENERGSVLKCLRTDNGLEFLSKEFELFCQERGIKRHRIVPMNPQQNGVAERANRTIMEIVRSMLLASGMEKRFWAEAAATAVKLINMCPSSSIDGDTPDYRWYGEYGDYSQLKVFGCKAFVHQKLSKLDARAVRCVLLGYQPGVKGYRLWCIEPGNQKIVVSRDVIFSETIMPFKSVEQAQNDIVRRDKSTSSLEVEHEPVVVNRDGSESDGEEHSSDYNQTGEAEEHEDLRTYQLARDRARRKDVRRPSRYLDSDMLYFAFCVAEQVVFSEPESYNAAINCKERDKWLKAMIEEMDSLIKNGTWVLVDKVEGRKIVSCKWIFKKKIESADNEKVRFKARGFTQDWWQEGSHKKKVWITLKSFLL